MLNTIKDFNRKKIINILYKEREITKQEIARKADISIPTVISNINELIEEGIAEESGVADSTGGRKPVVVSFIPDSRYSFGVDFTTDTFRVILTNLDSDIKSDETFNISDFKSIEDIMKNIAVVIEKMIEYNNVAKKNVLGVGFSLPGTVDEENLILQSAPNLYLESIDFKIFSEVIGLPLFIENEANAAAFAELTLGIAKKMKNLVYVSVTSGIGTGIVIQDCLYKGKNKRAGEFGHMTVAAGGKRCNCGRSGCWEMYASQRALVDSYRSRTGKKKVALKDFAENLKSNESAAMETWNEYLNYFAAGIQNIILILDPHYIIIGGEISNLGDMFIESLKQKVFIKNSFYKDNDTKIFASKLKDDSSILGASLLPFKKMFSLNENII